MILLSCPEDKLIAEKFDMFAAPWRYVCRSEEIFAALAERDMFAALGDMLAAPKVRFLPLILDKLTAG